MRSGEQNNPRNKLRSYFTYLIDRANQELPYYDMKINSFSEEPTTKQVSPTRRYGKDGDGRVSQRGSTISYGNVEVGKDKKSKKLRDKVSMFLNEEESPKERVKLPPIRRQSIDPKSDEYKKTYQEHHLESLRLDEGTLRLMEQNYRNSKVKHRQMLN